MRRATPQLLLDSSSLDLPKAVKRFFAFEFMFMGTGGFFGDYAL
jgi:hypothetical protein